MLQGVFEHTFVKSIKADYLNQVPTISLMNDGTQMSSELILTVSIILEYPFIQC